MCCHVPSHLPWPEIAIPGGSLLYSFLSLHLSVIHFSVCHSVLLLPFCSIYHIYFYTTRFIDSLIVICFEAKLSCSHYDK
jgi:hypothetical protein